MLSSLLVVLRGKVENNAAKMLWSSDEDGVTRQKYLFP